MTTSQITEIKKRLENLKKTGFEPGNYRFTYDLTALLQDNESLRSTLKMAEKALLPFANATTQGYFTSEGFNETTLSSNKPDIFFKAKEALSKIQEVLKP